MSTSRKLPLVVSPTISNCRVGRVLVDSDSSLDLLFVNTLDEMQIPRSKIKPMTSPFYRIVPGMSVTPMGQVVLPVTFGTTTNFRTKLITFEVVDFESAYNAILGRPFLTKFMAATHHAYQKIKIPGPKGVIAVQGDQAVALLCDRKLLELVDQLPLKDLTLEDKAGKSAKIKAASQPNEEVKVVPLSPDDQSKTVRISAGLSEK